MVEKFTRRSLTATTECASTLTLPIAGFVAPFTLKATAAYITMRRCPSQLAPWGWKMRVSPPLGVTRSRGQPPCSTGAGAGDDFAGGEAVDGFAGGAVWRLATGAICASTRPLAASSAAAARGTEPWVVIGLPPEGLPRRSPPPSRSSEGPLNLLYIIKPPR